ncbi:response regulator [Dongia sp.]|uniref:response regulator n=1 Tax=Dongia sp. TaxID=1977262 RepID=UPI00375221BA
MTGLPDVEKPEATVLVVDDDPDLLQSLRVLLEAYDYTVIMAANAAAAIAAVSEQQPDLVLTDIYMPDADGFELINALRQHNLNVPVVAMSGGGRVGGYDNLSVATHLGAVAVIDKPFSNASLIETIERVLSGQKTDR